jgi:hypothetical protein
MPMQISRIFGRFQAMFHSPDQLLGLSSVLTSRPLKDTTHTAFGCPDLHTMGRCAPRRAVCGNGHCDERSDEAIPWGIASLRSNWREGSGKNPGFISARRPQAVGGGIHE